MLGYIILLIAIGVVVHVIPIDPKIRTIIVVICAVLAVFLLLSVAPVDYWTWPKRVS